MADAIQALAAELNNELKHESTQTTSEVTEIPETKVDELVIELPPQDSVPPTTGNSQAQSPLSEETHETPGTEVSDIEALDKEFSAIKKSPSKENARAKAATLSLIEQVSHVLMICHEIQTLIFRRSHSQEQLTFGEQLQFQLRILLS